jgi:hypothetical protein
MMQVDHDLADAVRLEIGEHPQDERPVEEG